MATRFDHKFLYENSRGERLENFPLSWSREAAIRCTGNFTRDFDYGPYHLISGVNILFDPENSEFKKSFQSKEERVREVFGKSKEQAVQFLQQRAQRDLKAAPYLKNMIKRIEAVTLEIPRYQKKGFLGDCDLPNAYYQPGKASLLLCPQLLDLPEGALLGTILHELGHSVDPCNASLNYFQYPSGNFQITGEDESLRDDAGNDQSLELVIPKVGIENYPFRATLSCLQKPQAAGLAVPSQKLQMQSLEKSLQDKDNTAEDKEFLLRKKNEITRAFKENPYCRTYTDSSHSEELFSDWFSAQVMAQIISQNQSSVRKSELSYESMLFVIAKSCPELEKKVKNLFMGTDQKQALKKCELFDSEGADSEEQGIVHAHPNVTQRFERIILAQPTLQQALQCQESSQVLACP
jgi:hypothetical protein